MDDLVKQLRRLEQLIYGMKPVRELNTLTKNEQEAIAKVRDNVSLARQQVSFSLGDEDEEARINGFKLAIEQLTTANEKMLVASMQGLLDPVDVSQLSSLVDLCISRIEGILQA